MDNTANIPLGTPREGSWEQGCLTKHGGKGAWMGQAWKKILASRQCNRHNDRGWEAVSSPPQSAHYQEAHQCMSPENKAWKPHVPPHSALPPPHVCPLLFFQYEMSAGGFSPTWGWSQSEVWPSNSGIICLKPQQLMEHGEYNSDCSKISRTRKSLLFTKHLHLKPWRWAL